MRGCSLFSLRKCDKRSCKNKASYLIKVFHRDPLKSCGVHLNNGVKMFLKDLAEDRVVVELIKNEK